MENKKFYYIYLVLDIFSGKYSHLKSVNRYSKGYIVPKLALEIKELLEIKEE